MSPLTFDWASSLHLIFPPVSAMASEDVGRSVEVRIVAAPNLMKLSFRCDFDPLPSKLTDCKKLFWSVSVLGIPSSHLGAICLGSIFSLAILYILIYIVVDVVGRRP